MTSGVRENVDFLPQFETFVPNRILEICAILQRESGFVNNRQYVPITIPSSVKNIGDGAFEGCQHLTSINIPKNHRIFAS